LEEILFNEFKKCESEITSIKKSRFQSLKEITFDQFSKKSLFEKEFDAVKKIITENCM